MNCILRNDTWELTELPKVDHLVTEITFLHGDLTDEVYMQQPPDYAYQGKEHLVCKLKKSLCGLKQSAKAWNNKPNSILIKEWFQRGESVSCLKCEEGRWFCTLIFMDNLVLAFEDTDDYKEVEDHLSKEVPIKVSHYLIYTWNIEGHWWKFSPEPRT